MDWAAKWPAKFKPKGNVTLLMVCTAGFITSFYSFGWKHIVTEYQRMRKLAKAKKERKYFYEMQ